MRVQLWRVPQQITTGASNPQHPLFLGALPDARQGRPVQPLHPSAAVQPTAIVWISIVKEDPSSCHASNRGLDRAKCKCGLEPTFASLNVWVLPTLGLCFHSVGTASLLYWLATADQLPVLLLLLLKVLPRLLLLLLHT